MALWLVESCRGKKRNSKRNKLYLQWMKETQPLQIKEEFTPKKKSLWSWSSLTVAVGYKHWVGNPWKYVCYATLVIFPISPFFLLLIFLFPSTPVLPGGTPRHSQANHCVLGLPWALLLGAPLVRCLNCLNMPLLICWRPQAPFKES